VARKSRKTKEKLLRLEMKKIQLRKGTLPRQILHPKRKPEQLGLFLRLPSPQTTFDFLVTALNDASLDIVEKQEVKQEEVFSRIKGELQEVHQALQSSHAIYIAPSISGTEELGDEPAQLHQITNKVEAFLR
jgi:hypothetical protein